ncbi:MAG: response regulator transcription factor [Dehalococcoidia bacterium]
MAPIRIMLVEDHQIVREGLRRMLELEPDLKVVAEAASGDQALPLVTSLSPDIVLMDIKMPGTGGLELTRKLKELNPDCKVIVLTFYDNYLQEAIQAGAVGYLLKDLHREELVQAIRTVQEGRSPIHLSVPQEHLADIAGATTQQYSERELTTLRLVASGLPTGDIAAQLFVSQATVKRTLRQVFDKLGARNRSEAVAEASKRHLI